MKPSLCCLACDKDALNGDGSGGERGGDGSDGGNTGDKKKAEEVVQAVVAVVVGSPCSFLYFLQPPCTSGKPGVSVTTRPCLSDTLLPKGLPGSPFSIPIPSA